MQHRTFIWNPKPWIVVNLENHHVHVPWVTFWSKALKRYRSSLLKVKVFWSATFIKFLRCLPLLLFTQGEQRPVSVYCKNDNAHFCAACDATHHSEICLHLWKRTVMVVQPNPSSQGTALMYFQMSRKLIRCIFRTLIISKESPLHVCFFFFKVPYSFGGVHCPHKKRTQGFMKVITPWWRVVIRTPFFSHDFSIAWNQGGCWLQVP